MRVRERVSEWERERETFSLTLYLCYCKSSHLYTWRPIPTGTNVSVCLHVRTCVCLCVCVWEMREEIIARVERIDLLSIRPEYIGSTHLWGISEWEVLYYNNMYSPCCNNHHSCTFDDLYLLIRMLACVYMFVCDKLLVQLGSNCFERIPIIRPEYIGSTHLWG